MPQLAWQFVAAQKAVNPILAFCRGNTVHFLLVRITSILYTRKARTDSETHCESLLKDSGQLHKISVSDSLLLVFATVPQAGISHPVMDINLKWISIYLIAMHAE